MHAPSLHSFAVVLAFSILTTIVLRPYLPFCEDDGCDRDRAAIDILIDHAHGIECPRNFTLHLLTNGSHLFQIQSRTDHNGHHSFESCDISEMSNYPWKDGVPIGATVMNGSEALVLAEACERVSYHVLDHSQDAGPEETEVSLEEAEAGFVSSDIDPSSLFRGIYPGTLWCGFGNIADDIYSKLGEEEAPDECCRAHDLCKPIIEPFITKYHHRNPSFFPVSHCACDVRLYNCFRKVNSTASNEIGRLFFNFARMRCFDFEVRLVCAETWMGMCWRKEAKCAAFVKDNPRF